MDCEKILTSYSAGIQTPPDLKDLLTSSRQFEEKFETPHCRYCVDEKICELRGTVYLITFRGCGQKYVGETSRPLHKRLDEHRRALQNPSSYLSSNFSRHRTLIHTQAPAPEFDVAIIGGIVGRQPSPK
ncbi:hypothetical protein Y032_0204g1861 [Ancylostoma ceylanicum]|uniref:GIY-YIG domain-containing protein n=1 Tax=Ancylostoma ceylanicum TaxID=53326 RepID=A0A016SMJ0_9BILA|nr:hypothetical protein Y032_0204g1861 [Ancylostoma ceylanicum]